MVATIVAHTAPTKYLETPVSVIVLLVTLEPLPIADLSVSSAQIVLHNCPVLLTHVKTHVWADVELEPFVKSSDIIQFVHVHQAMKEIHSLNVPKDPLLYHHQSQNPVDHVNHLHVDLIQDASLWEAIQCVHVHLDTREPHQTVDQSA